MERGITFDRRAPSPGGPAASGIEGDLYLTSQRLVLVGRLTLALELAALEEAVRTSGRLLLLLRDGQGVALDVADPQLLWAEIAEARRLARSAQVSGAADPAAQPAAR
jgi:hypothetical protein